MSNCHTLIEIQEAFDSLRASIKSGRPGRGANVRLFNDADLTLRQAMVLAWLMDHKDSVYSTRQMCQELRIAEDTMQKIIYSLLERQFLEMKGEDIDVTDALYFIILDFQAMRECGMVSSWRQYYEHKNIQILTDDDELDDDENENKEDENKHIIANLDSWKSIYELEDEDALESMDDFDPFESEEESADDSEEYE